MSFRPVTTEEVSSITAPGLWTYVEGDEVEMERFCALVSGGGALGAAGTLKDCAVVVEAEDGFFGVN